MASDHEPKRTWPRVVAVVAAVLVGATGLFVVANWNSFALGSAIVLSPKRPALLRDASWDDPSSAQGFNARFAPGASEAELLDWLRENNFRIYPEQGRAALHVQSLPCNEGIQISWTSNSERMLVMASATVREAGCL
jgi:hypothetical protein